MESWPPGQSLRKPVLPGDGLGKVGLVFYFLEILGRTPIPLLQLLLVKVGGPLQLLQLVIRELLGLSGRGGSAQEAHCVSDGSGVIPRVCFRGSVVVRMRSQGKDAWRGRGRRVLDSPCFPNKIGSFGCWQARVGTRSALTDCPYLPDSCAMVAAVADRVVVLTSGWRRVVEGCEGGASVATGVHWSIARSGDSDLRSGMSGRCSLKVSLKRR